jgi:hypothetical protein
MSPITPTNLRGCSKAHCQHPVTGLHAVKAVALTSPLGRFWAVRQELRPPRDDPIHQKSKTPPVGLEIRRRVIRTPQSE